MIFDTLALMTELSILIQPPPSKAMYQITDYRCYWISCEHFTTLEVVGGGVLYSNQWRNKPGAEKTDGPGRQ